MLEGLFSPFHPTIASVVSDDHTFMLLGLQASVKRILRDVIETSGWLNFFLGGVGVGLKIEN